MTTVNDVLDAMEKNGYKKIRGKFILYSDDVSIVGACAVGQAALNLGINYMALWNELQMIEIIEEVEGRLFGNIIAGINDNTNLSVRNIARKVRREYAGSLGERVLDIK